MFPVRVLPRYLFLLLCDGLFRLAVGRLRWWLILVYLFYSWHLMLKALQFIFVCSQVI